MPGDFTRTDKEITEIYSRHVDTVYRVCYLFLKNIPDTEDAVQNTFVKLMNYSGSFHDSEHEKAWLIVTASNHCKNILRQWWRKRTDIDSLSEVLAANDPRDETLSWVLKLPMKYKTVIYLYYYEGYSTVEIAKMLHKNESTVRSQLHTGRNLLKISMGGEGA